MCGACGTPVTGWAERIAPLGAGVAERRARALATLVRASGSATARRMTIAPWHGGSLRLHGPSGWSFAPSLLAAARELTRRHGPLVPTGDLPESPEPAALDFRPTPEETAVWCTAVVTSGLTKHAPVVVTASGWDITMNGEDVRVFSAGRTNPALRAHRGAPALAAHWRRHHARSGTSTMD